MPRWGKLNDELIWVTQIFELVDERIRGVARDHRYFADNGVEWIFTFFRSPAYFTAKVYQKPPTGLNDYPSEVHRYRLDPAVAKCYDTSAGVGIAGRRKPEQKQKGGLSVVWLAVPALVLVAGMWYLPEFLAKGMARSVGFGEEKAGRALSRPKGAAVSRLPAEPFQRTPLAHPEPFPAESRSDGPAVTVRGVARHGDRVNVVLSDGRTLTERDRELQRIDRNGVVVNGQKLYFAQPSPKAEATSVPAPVLPLRGEAGDAMVIVPDSEAEEAKERVAGLEDTAKAKLGSVVQAKSAPWTSKVAAEVSKQVFARRVGPQQSSSKQQ